MLGVEMPPGTSAWGSGLRTGLAHVRCSMNLGWMDGWMDNE